jgi:hypothetical protein
MWIVCHTRTAVAGMSSDAASGSASATAFITAASEAGGRSRLVDTFDAEHIAAARHRVERAAERRQIIGAGHRIIHERAGEELSARIVVDPGFEQRLPYALRDAALDLTLDQHRLQNVAAIVDRVIGGELDEASVGVDLDLGDMATIGEGRRHIGGSPCVEILGDDALIREFGGPSGDIEERQLAVGAGDREDAVAIDDIRFRGFEEVCRDPPSFVDHSRHRLDYRAANRHRRTRCDGAGTGNGIRAVAQRQIDLLEMKAACEVK